MNKSVLYGIYRCGPTKWQVGYDCIISNRICMCSIGKKEKNEHEKEKD